MEELGTAKKETEDAADAVKRAKRHMDEVELKLRSVFLKYLRVTIYTLDEVPVNMGLIAGTSLERAAIKDAADALLFQCRFEKNDYANTQRPLPPPKCANIDGWHRERARIDGMQQVLQMGGFVCNPNRGHSDWDKYAKDIRTADEIVERIRDLAEEGGIKDGIIRHRNAASAAGSGSGSGTESKIDQTYNIIMRKVYKGIPCDFGKMLETAKRETGAGAGDEASQASTLWYCIAMVMCQRDKMISINCQSWTFIEVSTAMMDGMGIFNRFKIVEVSDEVYKFLHTGTGSEVTMKCIF